MITVLMVATVVMWLIGIWWQPLGGLAIWAKILLTLVAVVLPIPAGVLAGEGKGPYNFARSLFALAAAIMLFPHVGVYYCVLCGLIAFVAFPRLSPSTACKVGVHLFLGRCKCRLCGKEHYRVHGGKDRSRYSWAKDSERGHKWDRCKCTLCDTTRDKDHSWDGCTCTRCGNVRDESHKWQGCRCTQCGKTRDESHSWAGCKCSVCGKQRDEAHPWNGCKCRTCGKTRDAEHTWDGCKCSVCGKQRDEEHPWNGCKCPTCGKTRNEQHRWEEGCCSICGIYKITSVADAVQCMKSQSKEDAAELLSVRCGAARTNRVVDAILEMYAVLESGAKRAFVQQIVNHPCAYYPLQYGVDVNFRFSLHAIVLLGRLHDDSPAVLDYLDSFCARDNNQGYAALESLAELAQWSDAAVERLIQWHRRVDLSQRAGYELIKVRRVTRAIADSFRNVLNDGCYSRYEKDTAGEFFAKHPEYK